MVADGDVFGLFFHFGYFPRAGDDVHFAIRSDSDFECGDSLGTRCDEENEASMSQQNVFHSMSS